MRFKELDGKIISKFICLLTAFLFIHIVSFGFIEYRIIQREREYFKKYEKDMVFTQRAIIESKLENILLEIRYLLQNENEHGMTLSGTFCEECYNNIVEYAHSDKIDKKIHLYDAVYNKIMEINSVNEKITVDYEPKEEKWDGFKFSNTSAENNQNEIVLTVSDDGKNIKVVAPIIKFGGINGIVVTEYSFEDMTKKLKMFVEDYHGDTYIYNNDGKVIFQNKDRTCVDGYSVDKKALIKEKWDIIKNEEQNQHLISQGLITYQNIDIDKRYNEDKVKVIVPNGPWKVVVFNDALIYQVKGVTIESLIYYVNQYFGSQQLAMLLVVILAVMVQAYVMMKKKNREKLEEMASLDLMTGTYNRAKGMEMLHKEYKKAVQNRGLLTIAFIDINGLKVVNDSLGHASGDELIVEMVHIIKSFMNAKQFLIRLGGDEFLMILNDRNEEETQELFEEINREIEKHNIESSKYYNMSFSHGIAELEIENKKNIYSMINDADKKMYEHKKEMKKNLKILK